MVHLTHRQSEVLKTISRLYAKHGFAPSLHELADDLGISVNGTRDHLLALKRAGAVDWTKGKARTLRIL